MSSRTCEEIYSMYDQAAEHFRDALVFLAHFIAQSGYPTGCVPRTARYDAREWKKRMLWLDTKLKELGVE